MNTEEIWKPVEGFPNTEVSNKGRVRSLFRGAVKERSLHINDCGYAIVGLQNKNYRRTKRVHVLIANAFIGPNPQGLDVNHKDGNKLNNVVDNLEYMTRSENCKHGFRIGLSYTPFREHIGSNHPGAALTESDVIAMREAFASGKTRRELASKYGISYYTVWDITKRRSWTHV